MWQLCINGLDGKNYVVKIKSNEPEKTKVTTLKDLVREETGIAPEHQRLLYGAKQLADGKRLCDYPPLGNGASILLVLRLPGGGGFMSRSTNDEVTPSTRNIGKSIPRSDEDCIITLSKENALLTPCGHSISPEGLMEYCWNELSNIKHEIKCPLCTTDWSLEMIKRYGGASDTEMTQLELGLATNACKNDPTIRQCPFCDTYCERQDTSTNNVRCIACARKSGGGNKVFCWLCLKPWKSNLGAASCGNEDCDKNKGKLRRLKESPMTTVSFFPGKKIYQLRACPNCGVLIELKGGCKQMTCTCCKTEFCFICLRKRVDGCWSCGSYNTPCALAPIQTAIPSKK